MTDAENPVGVRCTVVKLSSSLAEDILNMRLAGATIDNNNEPAPENSMGLAAEIDAIDVFGEWGFKCVCYRKRISHINHGANILKAQKLWRGMLQSDWFLQIFPIKLFMKVTISEMNKIFNAGGSYIMWWEYMFWL